MKYFLQAAILLLIQIPFYFTCPAQKPKQLTSAEILLKMQKLNVLGSALYIAAHPDDENTRLISYLANDRMLNTAYLSLTRGDGGQNLVGPEIRDELGIIRTQELITARRIDGGSQFFTRANDFGYSKDPEETYNIWGKDEVLSDVVWVMREFQPDIIVNRFSGGSRKTHGHHTASALLSIEAFDLAGDRSAYPSQLNFVQPFSPSRIFFNTSWWFYGSRENFDKADKSNLFAVDVGSYNALLGTSYSEIAALSRSQHKSQGFGSSGTRGVQPEYLEWLAGSKPEKDILDGLDLTWTRVEGGSEIQKLVNQAISNYDLSDPSKSINELLVIYKKVASIKDEYWRSKKLEETKSILSACLGLYVEVSASDYHLCAGEKFQIEFESVNRSAFPVTLIQIGNDWSKSDTVVNQELSFNHKFNYSTTLVVPIDAPISIPYWLSTQGSLGLFNVSDQKLIGKAANEEICNFSYVIEFGDQKISFSTPLIFKKTDPVEGEKYNPVYVIPAVTMKGNSNVLIFPDNSPKKIEWTIRSGKAGISGKIKMKLPAGWRSEPAEIEMNFTRAAEEQNISIMLYPSSTASEGLIQASFEDQDGVHYNRSMVEIVHDHIPTQIHFPESAIRIVRLDLKKKGQLIGYVMGAGDDIPACLEQIGYTVELLKDEDIKTNNLAKYDAVIVGIRALNTNDRINYQFDDLLDYTKKGGTLILQYNTAHELKVKNPGPYPITISRDRVTVEDAAVRILEPDHAVLNFPNKITQEDFKNWKQERGLYFPDTWDPGYKAILSSNDPGEEACDGGLLVAEYGKGHFIYTGYSWFRNLPPGVPGAYRLFTNLISIGK